MGSLITIYDGWAEDFSTLGLGALRPRMCEIDWEDRGMYELRLEHSVDEARRWTLLEKECIIKAPGPVREAPIVEAEVGTGTVERQIYRVSTNGSRLRMRAKASTGAKTLGSYKPGTEVVRLSVSGDWARVIVVKGGATGWMHRAYLTFARTERETIVGDKPGGVVKIHQVGPQLFRIYDVDRDGTNGVVAVKAMHISYDLRGISVKGTYSPKNAPVATVLAELQARRIADHPFTIHCYVSGSVTGEYGGRPILDCIMDPEDGIAAQLGARVIQDNFDIYLLPDQVRDTGVRLRHRKNLNGIQMRVNTADVVTRIEPVGKDKNGKPLFLTGAGYVDSPRIGEYPEIKARRIEYDVQVGKDGVNSASAARTKLGQLAQADFAAGIDLPEISLNVNFIALGDTVEYAPFRGLQAVHPYDTVGVEHRQMGIVAKVRLTKCTWNSLAKPDGQYKSTNFGEVANAKATVYGYNIVRGAVNGIKIAPEAIDMHHYRDMSIGYAKIELAAIEQLMADSITALRGRFGEIWADKLTADELYAALANVVVLMVQQITAGTITTSALYAELARIITLRVQQVTAETIETDALYAAIGNIVVLRAKEIKAATIETDQLAAELGRFFSLYAKIGQFDFVTSANIVGGAMTLEKLQAGMVGITNLTVTQANMLNATIMNLVMPGEDGKYYAVVVGTDGVIRTEEVTVTEGEIAAGQMGDGRQIVATTINAESINGENISAQSAVINEILTVALTAQKITAVQAMISSASIPALYTTAVKALGDIIDISANRSVNILVRSSAVRRLDALPEDPVVGESIVYTGTQPHEALQWTGAGHDPSRRTYPSEKTGSSVAFADLSEDRALNAKVSLVATREGSGSASPTNPRRINGRSGIIVRKMGKNLIPPGETQTRSGITATFAGNTARLSGTATDVAFIDIPLEAPISNHAFVLGARNPDANPNVILRAVDPSGAVVSQSEFQLTAANATSSAFAATVAKITIRVAAGTKLTDFVVKPQLEIGAVGTPIEEYDGSAHKLPNTATLYGLTGYEDEIGNDGAEVHRSAFVVFDGSEAWSRSTLTGTNTLRFVSPVVAAGQASFPDGLCSRFEANLKGGMYSSDAEGWNFETGSIGIRINKARLPGYNAGMTDAQLVAAFKALLASWASAGAPLQALFGLSAPVVYTNSPTPITGNYGITTVASTSGPVTVSYTGSGWRRISNSIMGSDVQITDEYVRVQSQKFSVGSNSSPGDDALAIEDGTVSARMIESPSVAPAYAGPTSIEVTPTASEQEMEAGTAYRSLSELSKVLSRMRLPGKVTVTVAQTLNETSDIMFTGLTGGELEIVGAGTYSGPSDSMPQHMGFFYIFDSTTPITIRNLRLRCALSGSMLVIARNSTWVDISSCVIEDVGSGGYLVYSQWGASVRVRSCAVANPAGVAGTVFGAQSLGRIMAENIIGDLSNATVLMNVHGGMMSWVGTAPVCANPTLVAGASSGFATYPITTRVPYRGTAPAPLPMPVTLEIPLQRAAGHRTSDGWNGELLQGYTNNRGRCTACLWFDTSALVGKTIISAKLTLKRQSGVGLTAAAQVYVHGVSNATASGALVRGDRLAALGGIWPNQTREFSLPTSVVGALVAGSIKAIGLYTGEGSNRRGADYSENYARFHKTATLTVMYQ